MPRRPPSRNGTDGLGRRRLLAGVATGVVGVGLGLNVVASSAYSFASADRGSNVQVAGDTDGALLGLLVADTVKKTKQQRLVEITNNAGQTLTLDVALDDPTQGTLYGPNGQGSTVSLTLGAGGSDAVDIQSSEPKDTTVPFTITHDSADLSFDVNRSTTVTTGNKGGEVTIDKLQKFRKDQSKDEWTIKTLEASSTNYDLDEVELVVEESATGTVVATYTYDNINSTEFSQKGNKKNPGIVLQPDDANYDVTNQTYELTVTATDVDGNFAQDTATN